MVRVPRLQEAGRLCSVTAAADALTTRVCSSGLVTANRCNVATQAPASIRMPERLAMSRRSLAATDPAAALMRFSRERIALSAMSGGEFFRGVRGAARQPEAAATVSVPGTDAKDGWHEAPRSWEEPSVAWDSMTSAGNSAAASSSSSGRRSSSCSADAGLDTGGAEVRTYSAADINAWRAEFGFARRQHSLAQIGYTDDELLEWRRPFDEFARDGQIALPDFERFVARKYRGVIPADALAQKLRFFWDQFDRDGSNFVDFGEFIGAGLMLDVDCVREIIRKEGIEATFEKYAEDGFMLGHHFFQLMCDFRFFVATATDAEKLAVDADKDRDGLVNLSDFATWAGRTTERELGHDKRGKGSSKRRRSRGGGAKRVPSPPPELDE
eukprot:TRINITY_DN27098_c0_g1_i2.p1 TRINITY_DN27098_c0_g1~~TRINITY_DN27098_c0_g1_i2.p1  ORF type:complete len:384 (+),score=86.94 TRINITY_DN27098_c0_g1_i2:76-1227(+)